ncbi:coiled-coil domain-containing protein [Raineya orbicola]|jgi:cell division protein ZapB|uniref:Chromosome segregation protein SMC n=1 Tax=Raineya orbicola TaxID=2016530 RepID=A0A2N3II19_9BACT|nr:hypothetical protein [Raineya orbicola]PKQ69898.1 hypothetical protein Rain11_1095 [Raineya orbicola]
MTIEISRSDKRTTFFIVALVVLAIVNIILVYLMMQSKQESIEKDIFIEKQKAELEDKSSKLDSVSRELDIRIAEAKKMNRDYQALLELQEQLKKDIANARSSSNNIDVDKLVEQYDAKIRDYENLLAQKEGEIKTLQGEKNELSKKVTQSETEKKRLADSMSNIQKQKKDLEATLAKAAILRAESIKLEGLDEKGKSDDDGNFKAKRLAKLKINVKIMENNAAKAGSRNIYVRIIEPSGAVMVGADGGRFADANGKEMNYTTLHTFNFNNEGSRNTEVIFRKGNQFQKGTHLVELYCEGQLLGKTSFSVN